jgi:hypothetical protein
MNQPTLPHRNESAADPIDVLLDAQLAGDAEDLAPSSGFVLSVMDSIRAQASEPPPIIFPWRRIIPGVVATLCGLIALVVVWVRMISRANAHLGPPVAITFRLNLTPIEAAIAWVLLAAAVSAAAVAASFRLTGRS